MTTTAKTVDQFAANEREKIADQLNPFARERFLAGKLPLDVIEYRGEGVRSMERAIAAKRRNGQSVTKDELEELAFVKKWTADPIIVIPTDLAA
ncbi:hypothetical protein CcrC1_gp091 [Caulobacter phage C1]|nr:hypothetical protein CcrC1_gp091 [Caulobacter phage C1]UTU08319.1 hypothetical protein CcrC2_gp091 [Caulobacter phage C2]UTU08840.1 hypothetical protein CcrJ4_gp089 [Caulobacter phage J4]UTU09393.1 hypothetical protein CcrBL47_gp107 [Caulobacter phage BL47]UTU09953.1 hypothetical protein CcrRB23_gp091 [Caulobacter phage RB23]WGN96978.1 hypothetical protein [Bertelyvirus sp.]